jgi:hypothetical protein
VNVTITKKLVGDRIVITPGWISNGFWAVKREHVANNALFLTEESCNAYLTGKVHVGVMPDDHVFDDLLKTERTVEFKDTGIAMEGKGFKFALFESADSLIFLQAEAAKAFGFTEVMGANLLQPTIAWDGGVILAASTGRGTQLAHIMHLKFAGKENL